MTWNYRICTWNQKLIVHYGIHEPILNKETFIYNPIVELYGYYLKDINAVPPFNNKTYFIDECSMSSIKYLRQKRFKDCTKEKQLTILTERINRLQITLSEYKKYQEQYSLRFNNNILLDSISENLNDLIQHLDCSITTKDKLNEKSN